MNNLRPNILRNLIISAIALLFSVPAIQAAPKEPVQNWYTVEVISFSRSKSPSLKEKWRAQPVAMDETTFLQSGRLSAIESDQAMQQRALPNDLAIQSVPAGEWLLSRHAYSLGRSPELKIQSHQAWRQPGLSREESPWINLDSESNALTGKIKISLSRYLHADLDITLPNPDWSPMDLSTAEANNQGLQQAKRIHFQASRRMKLDEIHYIDHPLAGVIIRIERVETPQATLETDEPSPLKPGSEKEPNSPIPDTPDKKTDT